MEFHISQNNKLEILSVLPAGNKTVLPDILIIKPHDRKRNQVIAKKLYYPNKTLIISQKLTKDCKYYIKDKTVKKISVNLQRSQKRSNFTIDKIYIYNIVALQYAILLKYIRMSFSQKL